MKEYVSKEATAKFLYASPIAMGLSYTLAAVLSKKHRVRNGLLAGLAGAAAGYAYDRAVTRYRPLGMVPIRRWTPNEYDSSKPEGTTPS